MTAIARGDAEDLLYREAQHLDRREWDAWLALYEPDCLFWLPAWRDEANPTSDPDRELSLIYYKGRRNLEDRVWRLRSGTSVASLPLARTAHLVTNVLVERADQDGADVAASFAVHRHDPRTQAAHIFFGRYEYRLVPTAEGLRIAAKKILLLNDVIPTVLDVYSI